MTLLQIVDKFERIALSQPNINSVGEGNVYDFNNDNPNLKYGVFFITQNTHIEYEESDRYGLTLFYIDRLEDDLESNRLRIQSHGKQVLGNIITMFCNDFDIDFPEITYTPFTQKFVDLTAGVYANILIDVYKDTLCEDGESPTWEKIGVLQNKQVNITENGTIMITADAGYDGLKSVELNVNVVDEDCYERGLEDGFESGTTYQKSLLSSTALTENGTYTSENGFSAVTVNVHPDTTDLTVTVNGQYTPPSGFIGYSAVTVNVNSGDCNMQILNVALETENGEQVSASTFTVSYFGQEDVYTYNGQPQEVAVYPGIEYTITFGEYEHHIAPDSVSGTSSWGNYTYITGVYKWQSACYVDPESVEFEATGGSAEISIVADGAWTATSTGDWYVQSTATGTGDGSISIAATGNTTGDILQGYINVEFYDGTTGQTYVSQRPIVYLDVDEKHILFEHSGSSYHLAVSSNTDYSITVPDWITYTYEDNLLKLTASDLGNSQGRHDFIVFTYDGYTKAIDVNQVNPDYLMYVTSSDTFTTELIQNNSALISNNNVDGETFIGSNCQHILSGSVIPDLQMFAFDIPTTTCDIHSCACAVSSEVDLMVLPKNVILPSSYYHAYAAFTGLKVNELRINCDFPSWPNTAIEYGYAQPSLAFNYVKILKVGPDSTLTNFGLISGYKAQTGGLNGYVYTSFGNYKIFYQPTPNPANRNILITGTSPRNLWFLQYAGVGTIHSSGAANFSQYAIQSQRLHFVPSQVVDVTVPSYIREKFV